MSVSMLLLVWMCVCLGVGVSGCVGGCVAGWYVSSGVGGCKWYTEYMYILYTHGVCIS